MRNICYTVTSFHGTVAISSTNSRVNAAPMWIFDSITLFNNGGGDVSLSLAGKKIRLDTMIHTNDILSSNKYKTSCDFKLGHNLSQAFLLGALPVITLVHDFQK